MNGSPLCSPSKTVPVSRSTDAAKIGESAAKLTPVSMRKSVSEFAMLSPSPPMINILFPKNSDEPPSPLATPLKKPSRLNAEGPPKVEELPNCVNESSSSWGFEKFPGSAVVPTATKPPLMGVPSDCTSSPLEKLLKLIVPAFEMPCIKSAMMMRIW